MDICPCFDSNDANEYRDGKKLSRQINVVLHHTHSPRSSVICCGKGHILTFALRFSTPLTMRFMVCSD